MPIPGAILFVGWKQTDTMVAYPGRMLGGVVAAIGGGRGGRVVDGLSWKWRWRSGR